MKKNIPALLIALGIVVLGWFIYSALNNLAYRDRQVQVRGLAEKEVMANKVTWPLVMKNLGNNLPQLYEQINTTNAIAIKFLKENGISEDEICLTVTL